MKLCENARFSQLSKFGQTIPLILSLLAYSAHTSPSFGLTNLHSKNLKSTNAQMKQRYGAGGTFGSLEIGTNLGAGKAAWRGLVKRLDVEIAGYGACDRGAASCNDRVRAWRKGIQEAKSFSSIWKKLDHINRLANRLIRYRDDIDQFNKADYWATPAQSIAGRGDCEDYAIAKFSALSELGISQNDLKLVVVQDTKRKLAHAVLAFKYQDLTIILDNLSNNLKSHTEIKNYRPVYSINRVGYWMNVAVKVRDTRIARIQNEEVSKHVLAINSQKTPPKQNGMRGSLAEDEQGTFLPVSLKQPPSFNVQFRPAEI